MPDNWTFVFAAYALTATVLGLYWRHLVRKEKELHRRAPDTKTAEATARTVTGTTSAGTTGSARSVAGVITAHTEREGESTIADRRVAERSRQPSRSGHPRPDPTTRGPLQS
jgi:hypothetical protein